MVSWSVAQASFKLTMLLPHPRHVPPPGPLFKDLFRIYFDFMCLSVLPATLVCTDARSEWRPEEDIEVIDGYELPCGCWNLYLQEEQPVPLTTEPSL